MRRIVHYYPDAMGHSGVTFALWSWARAQAAAGADVCVLHAAEARTAGHAAFVSKTCGAALGERSVPHRGRHRLTHHPVGLDRVLGRNDLLVLHEGWVTSNAVAAAAAQRAGVPYVVMPHGVYERAWTSYLKGPRAIRNAMERRVLERAAAVHVFFESEIADIRAIAPRATFLTVPTGFDVPADSWTGGGGYLAWVGRIDPVHKGLDALVGAVARLAPAERPVVRIKGYDYKGGVARLAHLVAVHRLEPWVRIEGAVAGDEKARFMRQADGYVHPSRWECHSIALLEHLALGVPCLVSRTIHIAPTLEGAGAALLAQPTEPHLAAALTRLGAAGRELSVRGRALVRGAFSWNAVMPRFDAAMGRLGLA